MGVVLFSLGFLCGVSSCIFAFMFAVKPKEVIKTETTYVPQSTDKPVSGVYRDKEMKALEHSQE